MNGLTESVSNLSLDQSSGKKNKRPFRAFHNFSNATQANAPGGPGIVGTTYSAAPTRFETAAANLRGNVPETEKYSANTVGHTLPPAPTSHLVAAQRIEDQQQMLSRTFIPTVEVQPPLATTQFYSARQSVCDPRLLSLSMSRIPITEPLRAATKLPVCLAVQPFAKEVVLDGEVQVVDARAEDGPLRCRRCRSYVNPKYVFTHDYKAVCNMCQIKTQVPHQRYGPLSMGGPELGGPEDPERSNGVVEFMVPELYNVKQGRPAVPLHYVFLVDVSFWANENKSSLAAIEGVRTAINYIAEKQPNCKVAIIAYDRWLRFFNLRPESPHAQELIVSEVNEIFLPLYSGLFVRPEESMHVIQDTLSKLEAYIQDDKYSHKAESCLGSALEAALLALNTVTDGNGGKIIASMNTMPTIGLGNLSIKKDDGLKKNLKCENEYYGKLAQDMLKGYVSVDLFCTGSMFLDLATLGHASMITSGVVKHYPNFHINKDEFTVVNDMLHSVSSIVGYQAQLKVRCSSGLSVSNYHTMACGNSDKDPVIPVLTRDQNVMVSFKYDDKLKPGSEVSFQAALLYTDVDGVRKVRSINLNAVVTAQIEEIFRYANQDVIASAIIKDALFDINDGNFVHVRKSVENKLTNILTQYRALVDGMHGSQLIIPDSLKALPAYLLSFQKSELLRNNTHSSRSNERLIDYFKYHTYNLHQLSYKLYPQIFPLHEPLADEDFTFYDENNLLLQIGSTDVLTVTNSHSSLISGGCYLICHGDVIYLWFNEHTNANLLSDLLTGSDPGTLHYGSISLFGAQLPEVDTDINFRARNIVQYWSQLLNSSYIPVLPLRPNVDQYYSAVMSSIMCEDKSIEMIEAYNNYLVVLHRAIKDNIDHDRYVKPSTSAMNDGDNLSSFIQF